jgi:hypothetical protein
MVQGNVVRVTRSLSQGPRLTTMPSIAPSVRGTQIDQNVGETSASRLVVKSHMISDDLSVPGEPYMLVTSTRDVMVIR